jgi:signal peptidase I
VIGFGPLAVPAAALAVAIAALARLRRRYVVVVVVGHSMQPTLADGDRLLVRRASHGRYRVGQIVVFKTAGPRLEGDPAWRIKRVAALPGDPAPAWMRTPAATVPPGHLVVRGDNPRSETSEEIGYLPLESILGTAHPRPRLAHA